jgi:phosphate transport system protein
MQIREHFEKRLRELQIDTMALGRQVTEQLRHAMETFTKRDVAQALQVRKADKQVNHARFAIEEQCIELIATQQPSAGDLRRIVAVMNAIVDLERVGDHAKSIAKVVPHLQANPHVAIPESINAMYLQAHAQLRDAMYAYAADDVQLAKQVFSADAQLDRLYAQFYTEIITDASQVNTHVEVDYQLLRAARELERIGDLATNIAERVIYIVTGDLSDENFDPDDVLDAALPQ